MVSVDLGNTKIFIRQNERVQAKVAIKRIIRPARRSFLSGLHVDIHHPFVGGSKRRSSSQAWMICSRSIQNATEGAWERLTGIPLTRERPRGVRVAMAMAVAVMNTWCGTMAGDDRRNQRSACGCRWLRFFQTGVGNRDTRMIAANGLRWLRVGYHARPSHRRAELHSSCGWKTSLARVKYQTKRLSITGSWNCKRCCLRS